MSEILSLSSPLNLLKGVGEARYKQLQEVGLSTVADLIDYWPRKYIDYSDLSLIKDIKPGPITLKVKFSCLKSRYARGRAMHLTEAIAEDEKGGKIPVVWFNQPYRINSTKTDSWYYVSCEYKPTGSKLNLTNPNTEEVKQNGQNSTARVVPVYPEKLNLNSRLVREMILQLEEVFYSIRETLPKKVLEENKLISKSDALWQLHSPESMQALDLAKRRLAFEEILTLQLAIQKNKQFIQKLEAPKIKFNLEDTKKLVGSLKFKLTDDQRAAAWQILKDLEENEPMNRMLMGDVGSGKTVVAALAALQAIKAGKQVAVLAPTEVLARQHHKSFSDLLAIPSNHGKVDAKQTEGLSLPYNPKLLDLAKKNRKKLTKYETIVWSQIKGDQIGYDFTRQQVIGNYIVDFYCPKLKLVIEIDGDYHDYISDNDQSRQQYLESLDLHFIRISNNDVNERIGIYIKELCEKILNSNPSALLKRDTFPKGRTTTVDILVGSMKSKEKKEILDEIENGSSKFIVGTHALIQQKVKFNDLAFVIVDEQHRFGVNQRKELQKRVGEGKFPHLLTMTATPIPRSLALILYGELEQSLIKTKPPGRIEIKTELIPGASKQKVWDKLKEELSLAHAAIFVCPNITDTENSARVAAEKVYEELSKKAWIKKYGLGVLHGKLKSEEKEQIMADFASGKINTLVSTTVIEVGIDIPRATLMVIEGAEYFGLAQLHQLRGRVGRSNLPSYCYLVPANNQNIPKRLRYFAENSDGFKLAEYDLEERGPGQIYGKLQSGALDLRLINIHDLSLVKQAKTAAEQILKQKLTLSTELKANIAKHQDLEYLN